MLRDAPVKISGDTDIERAGATDQDRSGASTIRRAGEGSALVASRIRHREPKDQGADFSKSIKIQPQNDTFSIKNGKLTEEGCERRQSGEKRNASQKLLSDRL